MERRPVRSLWQKRALDVKNSSLRMNGEKGKDVKWEVMIEQTFEIFL